MVGVLVFARALGLPSVELHMEKESSAVAVFGGAAHAALAFSRVM